MSRPYGFVKERDLFEWLVDKVSAPEMLLRTQKLITSLVIRTLR